MSGLIGMGSLPTVGFQGETLARFSYTQYHMGVDARIVVYAPNQSVAESACAAAFKRIAALDTIMSDYRADSELMKLCDKSGGAPVRVSADLYKVLKRGYEVSEKSAGAFDMTVGPLVRLWRAARKSKALPTKVDLDSALKLVGWRKMVLNDCARTVHLELEGMKLDLGGIAKGYACDEAQRVLKRNGVQSALVEMGGDIVVSAAPPNAKGWTIRLPNAGEDHGPVDRQLANCAISTSGDTEQFVVIGGLRYSHVIDPRSGQALTNRVQVTLIAPNGLTSDPLTKTLCILPKEIAAKALKSYRGVTYFVRVLPFSENAP